VRGIQIGQAWRANFAGDYWRVVAIEGQRITLVAYHGTLVRRVNVRQMHDRARKQRGYRQVPHQVVERELQKQTSLPSDAELCRRYAKRRASEATS